MDQHAAEQLVQTINDLQQQMQALRQDQETLRSAAEAKTVTLSDTVRHAISPHLQYKPLEKSERKKLLAVFPKLPELPKSISDENGFAGRALQGKEKQILTKDVVGFQRDALEVLRAAASAWHIAGSRAQQQDAAGALSSALDALKAITVLACDNAQRLADWQLKYCLEAAGAKNAESLLSRKADDSDFDTTDSNIFQQSHVDAIAEMRKYNASMDANIRAKKNKNSNANTRYSNQRGRGGRYNNNYNNNYRGRGGYRGTGRGRGRSPFFNRPGASEDSKNGDP